MGFEETHADIFEEYLSELRLQLVDTLNLLLFRLDRLSFITRLDIDFLSLGFGGRR
jgi:hypothetical protein